MHATRVILGVSYHASRESHSRERVCVADSPEFRKKEEPPFEWTRQQGFVPLHVFIELECLDF